MDLGVWIDMDTQDLAPITASAVIIMMAGYGVFVMFPALFSAFMVYAMPLVVLIIGCCGAWHYVFQADYGPAQTEARTYSALLPRPIQDIPQPPEKHDNLEKLLNHEVVQEAPCREQKESRAEPMEAPRETNITYNINDSVAILRNKIYPDEVKD